ncbi:MAG: DUF1361 domain-containing protein [Limnothrix sp.]
MTTLKLVVLEIYRALNNVYSGWILWNLFLAFIPLLISFLLFRRHALTKGWAIAACFTLGLMSVVGTRLRTPWVFDVIARKVDTAIGGALAMSLNALWLVAILVLTLAMSILIFKRDRTLRSVFWWLAFVTFMAFLPNAPYVLTDIIHLIRGVSSGNIPIWVAALVIIPIHAVAILLGFEAYVISLLNLDSYLVKHNHRNWILPTELTIHLLNAIGIYLGRFIRFNSWDLVTDPSSVVMTTINTLTSTRPLAVIAVTFVVLTVLYWLMKQITLGLKLRIQYVRKGIDVIN